MQPVMLASMRTSVSLFEKKHPMMSDSTRLDALASRVSGLYSLPAVAVEVVQLTNDPNIDAAALTRCLEKDPALTVKVLRVVNSSLFGLSREVGDLNQAIALLGSGPLKLLVLGFSLPEELFDGPKKELLQWYWTTSLTRAVAARQLSKSLWNDAGNEAFLAALLQDIGLLALLKELDEAFANFLSRVIDEQGNLADAEREALGFDHRDLSVAMLQQWKLPQVLVESISMSELPLKLARQKEPAAEIAKVLHLADLVAQLVGQRRIGVLPDLLETGKLYRELTKQKLYDIVGELQPQVDQLASVLSLELPDDRNYVEVLRTAHDRLAEVAEQVAGTVAQFKNDDKTDDEMCEELLTESKELAAAMEAFLQPVKSVDSDSIGDHSGEPSTRGDAPHQRTNGEQRSSATAPAHETTEQATSSRDVSPRERLRNQIASASRSCRMQRAELSLLLIELDGYEQIRSELGISTAISTMHTLETVLRRVATDDIQMERTTDGQLAVISTNCDRRQAVALANEVFVRFAEITEKSSAATISEATLSAAVATASSIFKNFSADTLVEGAERCLSAARTAGGTTVKSIEVL